MKLGSAWQRDARADVCCGSRAVALGRASSEGRTRVGEHTLRSEESASSRCAHASVSAWASKRAGEPSPGGIVAHDATCMSDCARNASDRAASASAALHSTANPMPAASGLQMGDKMSRQSKSTPNSDGHEARSGCAARTKAAVSTGSTAQIYACSCVPHPCEQCRTRC